MFFLLTFSRKDQDSLLFDARKASDVDAQTIHHIAVNGLLELRNIDERFEVFEDNLFGFGKCVNSNSYRSR